MLTVSGRSTEGMYAYHLHWNERQGDQDSQRDHGRYLRDSCHLGNRDLAGRASKLTVIVACASRGGGMVPSRIIFSTC